MKILKLKFKNINSLVGENEIDFTNPVFTNEGLFAITGKTGAGKSSILDAICLALYGRTPRVKITGSENHVLTRGQSDCYAEITFEVGGYLWKSSWKQELTRTGNLKPVSRQIADVHDHIIADQIHSCDTKIIEIIGLTFEQFTKVIMLAQGSFAAFLEAEKNNKGELLEQITGTEIYAEISQKVYERTKSEKEKLEKILIEQGAIKILSSEEIHNYGEQKEGIEQEKKQLEDTINALNEALNWHQSFNELQKQIGNTKEHLPGMKETLNGENQKLENAKKSFSDVKNELITQEPIFKKTRELDVKIEEKLTTLKPINNELNTTSIKLENLKFELSNINKQLDESKEIESAIRKWSIENKIYETLNSSYAVIEKDGRTLVEMSHEIQVLKEQKESLENKINTQNEQLTRANENCYAVDSLLSTKISLLSSKKDDLKNVLEGKELSDLQKTKETISELGIELKSLKETEESLRLHKAELDGLDTSIQAGKERLIKLKEREKNRQDAIANYQSKIHLLEENINLTKAFQSLADHRNELEDGKPCPLCGSLEHPFSDGEIPVMGEKEQELHQLKNKLTKLNQESLEVVKSVAKISADLTNSENNRTRVKYLIQQKQESKDGLLSNIKKLDIYHTLPLGNLNSEVLTEILTNLRNQYNKMDARIKKHETETKEINHLRDVEIPNLQKQSEQAKDIQKDLKANIKLTEQTLKDKSDILSQKVLKYSVEDNKLKLELQKYNVSNIEELQFRKDEWEKNQNDLKNIREKIDVLKNSISQKEYERETQNKIYEAELKKQQNINTELDKLTMQRQEIFGNKSVEEVESQLKFSLEQCENAKNHIENQVKDIESQINKFEAVLAEKNKELVELQGKKKTDKSTENLDAELLISKSKLHELSQSIGAINQTLETNQENIKSNEKKIKEKEKQQNIYNTWAKLNELIGSSDGKKYRNFAQALTFEHLTHLSNLQLQKMSDRYLLRQTGDVSNPFELSVIDKFQNNEERTAQNLSGGEKFIVSLALALGLASMAGKNMSIDTMFVDEGFGTLDSDYLDIALNTLSNLQNEGKIIGVISHLNELKERIATHIEIIPSGGGHSKIQLTY
ncbi:MAG TPA: SbcC/MukB-like Walker B domain-containing protein [Saprospiraceae bacterium]|nr:SbcC/MukB-like Walker B domain-containing protein [Saprospiraceae bacterium]